MIATEIPEQSLYSDKLEYCKEREKVMNTIKFTVEDSKAAEILKVILNSDIAINDVEVTSTQYSKAATVSESSVVETSGSSFTLYRHSYSIGQNEGTCTADVISGVKFVGGTIFYIDDTADGEYQFFDADGNVIKNVQVGDRPYYYRIIKKGSRDKYFVYYDEVFDKLRWTWAYYGERGYAYESLSTSRNIGSGKINTKIAMAKDGGIYVTADSNRMATVWYRLQQVRSDEGTGCNDWFVPSIDELELLRLAIKSGSITGGIIAGSSYNKSVFNNKWIWSSSELLSQRAWYWHHVNQCWDGGNKGLDFSVIFTRAF